MSVSMSSRDRPELTQGPECLPQEVIAEEDLAEVYELERCVDWIQSSGYSKVALQFPDYLLSQAPIVCASLRERLDRRAEVELYILGDTTYGECCVDEIAAEHMAAEALVHYGHTCLTPPHSLPTLWVFTRRQCSVPLLRQLLQEKFSSDPRKVILLLYDVEYEHLLGQLEIDKINLVIGRCSSSSTGGVQKFGRKQTCSTNSCVSF